MEGLIQLEFDKAGLDKSISDGLEFLYKNQLPYGEFKTYVSPDKSMKSGFDYISTTYITSFVIYSISFIKDSRVDDMTRKALDFFLKEMEAPGVWRFFSANRSIGFSEGSIHRYSPWGITPDLDDTACIAYHLKKNQVDIVIDDSIFYKNRNQNGAFYTWLLDFSARKEYDEKTVYMQMKKNDICCGVNANILLHLGENSETHGAIQYLNDIIYAGEEEKNILYFPDKLSLYYLVSRAYFNGVQSLCKNKDLILDRIRFLMKNPDFYLNILNTAYAICTFQNFKCDDEKIRELISMILHNQYTDGCWRKERFCDEPVRCYSSEELTTSICLEALSRYRGGMYA